jgi:hypothetical protein
MVRQNKHVSTAGNLTEEQKAKLGRAAALNNGIENMKAKRESASEDPLAEKHCEVNELRNSLRRSSP